MEISRNWAAASSWSLVAGFGAVTVPVGVSFSLRTCCYKRTCGCSGAQSCPTLCDPMDCGLPGSFVCGIFQTKMCILKLRSSGSWICLLSWIHWFLSVYVHGLCVILVKSVPCLLPSCFPLTSITLFPPPLAPGNHHLIFCFYEIIFFGSAVWHVGF